MPDELVRGIDRQRRDMEQPLRSYVRGEFQMGGWWWFYLYGLLVKLPLGTLALIALSAALMLVPEYRAKNKSDYTKMLNLH